MPIPEESRANYSLSDPYSSHADFDKNLRAKKAAKIISVLAKHADLASCDVLDIGTGSGHIVQLIGRHCRSATSVNLKDERVVKDGYQFRQIEDVHLPFDDGSFDIVISNQVIEHIPPQDIHIREIARVLKKGGLAYLATPSKFTVLEPHFKLPFLSWLPRPMSQCYVKLFKKKEWDIYPLSLGHLKRLTEPYFELKNMSIDVIKHPEEFHLDMLPALQPVLKNLPIFLLRVLQPFFPSFIVILRKKMTGEN